MSQDIRLVLLATVVLSGDRLQSFAASPSWSGAPVLLVAVVVMAATLALNPSKLGAVVGRQSERKTRKPRPKRPQAVRP